MPRRPRISTGGMVFHTFNRAARKLPLFEWTGEYEAFVEVVTEAQRELPMRIACYCVMPNHWHLVLWPALDGDLTPFMTRVTKAHAQLWRARRETVGQGAVYQGRFKAIPVQCDHHFLSLCRYVERNPVRAGLVARAQDWRWSSAGRHAGGDSSGPALCDWPVARPADWESWVNASEPKETLHAARAALTQNHPWGTPAWQVEASHRLGLPWPRRAPGRPRSSGETPRSRGDLSAENSSRSSFRGEPGLPLVNLG